MIGALLGGGAAIGSVPSSPYGRWPRSLGRSRMIIGTAKAATPSITQISPSAMRQPTCSVRAASSGRNSNWPVATLAVRMPTTRPRRATNQRAEIVAPSTSAVMPVPRPITTPHSSTRCQTCVMNSEATRAEHDDQQRRQRHVAQAVAVQQRRRERRHQPEQDEADRQRRGDFGRAPAEFLLQRHDEHAGRADGAGRDQRGEEGHADHRPAVMNIAAGEGGGQPVRNH